MNIFTPKPFLWVAFPSMLGGYDKIIELAKRFGFGGIAPRAGTGGWNDPTLKASDIRKMRDADLEVDPWVFSKPHLVMKEVADAKRLEDAGATCYIIDAELPWDQALDAKSQATLYGNAYRATCTIPVFDAPWPAIAYHPGYPEVEFRWVDGRMPQAYWTEIGWSARKTFDVMHAQWHGRDARLLPIGITYGREELIKWGSPQLPPGRISVEDVAELAGEITGGWYSAEASGPGVLDAIAAAIAPKRPAREPGLQLGDDSPAVPFAFVDRAEWDASEDERNEAITWHLRNRDVYETYGERDTDPAPTQADA